MCMVNQRPLYDSSAQVAAEHEELLESIVAHDQRRAASLFRAHLAEAAQRLQRSGRFRDRYRDEGEGDPVSERL